MSTARAHVKLDKLDELEAQNLLKAFDHSDDFPDACIMFAAFRTIGSRKNEHWLNKYAARMTRRPGDVSPGGRMCHVEVILAVRPGVYVKTSVIKKSWVGKREDGSDIWKPGGVHLKRTDPAEWQSKYVFLKFACDRASIHKMFKFLVVQSGHAFNPYSYYAALTPYGWGVNRWTPEMMSERDDTAWFCSEFLTAALQCAATGGSHKPPRGGNPDGWRYAVWRIRASTSNPNMLYRLLSRCQDVYSDGALGSGIITSI